MKYILPLSALSIVIASVSAYTALAAANADLVISVKSANGMPVHNAVVMVYPSNSSARPSSSFSGSNTMTQENIEFSPGTLIIAKGSTVRFPNKDRVRHSIYSFSKAAKFQIKLFGRDQTRTKNFAIAGTVALGCHIHDNMKGYIKVVDTPYAAKTDQNGQITLRNMPVGSARIKVWHPNNRAKENETISTAQISSSANKYNIGLKM